MTELELIVDFHKDADRQGPGSREETLKAFELTGLSTNDHLKIADIGCGTGSQTLDLAKHTKGEIVAVDIFPEFLEKLNKNAEEKGYDKRISTLKCSMDNLPLTDESFDLIWSEGAIYNMGFEAGVKEWSRFLKPGGYLCVSEITWITNSRPKALEKFWHREYREIGRASNKINVLEENGFTLTGYFYLKEKSWIENYYNPMESRFESFLERHNCSESAKNVVEENKKEIQLYNTNKEYYSYGFYIARKNR